MLTKFQPSGKTAPLTFILALVAVVAAVPLACIYQFLINVIPSVKVEFILVFFGGLGVGALAHLAIRHGKCRNPVVGGAIGLATAVAALCVSYVFCYWSSGAAKQGASFGDYIAFRVQVGWTLSSVGSSKPSGPGMNGFFVYVMWAIEALIFCGAGVVVAFESASSPFCEECDRWANKSLSEVYIDSPGAAGIATLKQATEISTLIDPPAPGQDAGGAVGKDRVLYSLTGCPSCGGSCTLSLKHFMVTGKGKRQETKTDSLHKHIALSPEEAKLVRELIEPEESPKATPPLRAAA